MDDIPEEYILCLPLEDDDGPPDDTLPEIESCVEGGDQAPLPAYFSTWDIWPKQTGLSCWFCGLPVQGVPWFISLSWSRKVINPQSLYNTNTSDDSIKDLVTMDVQEVYGVFGSPCCITSYLERIRDNRVTNTTAIKNTLFENISSRFLIPVDHLIEEVPPAPDPHEMIHYKGNIGITPEEYRQKIKDLFQSWLVAALKRARLETAQPPICGH